MSSVRLKKRGESYEFESEAALEDFVWDHLALLFGFTPLARQYAISGLFCDLLALNSERQLVVIELKNTEDRYIVQQLTRYYDRLIKLQPFSEMVDYNKPILLVGVAPIFHEDNYTDCKYHKLSVSLLRFQVVDSQNSLIFQLSNLDANQTFQQKILYLPEEGSVNIPSPPSKLTRFLSKNDHYHTQTKETIFRIRQKILSFDERITEKAESNKIVCGKGGTLCAEFYLGGTLYGESKIHLFLYLPELNPHYKHRGIRRCFINSDDWQTCIGIQLFSKGFTSSRNRSQNLYIFPDFLQNIRRWYGLDPTEQTYKDCFESYEKLLENESNPVDALVDVALQTWLKRVSK